MPQYGECNYWDERYTREPAAFDWYQGFSGLSAILQHVFPMQGTLLQIGVGSSRLQEEMAQAGWRRIVNIDYSRVVITHMTELHKGNRALEYRVADARHMPEFQDGSFDGVLDKGTLDAILCGDYSGHSTAAMITECYRVLRPGAALMLVTYGDPASRLPYLDAVPGWDIVVYALTKQEVLEAMDAEPIVRPLIKGPYPASNGDCMDALSGLEGMHFVYVCRKHREGEQGRREALRASVGQEPLGQGAEGLVEKGSRNGEAEGGRSSSFEGGEITEEAQPRVLSQPHNTAVSGAQEPTHSSQKQQQTTLSGVMEAHSPEAFGDEANAGGGGEEAPEAPGTRDECKRAAVGAGGAASS